MKGGRHPGRFVAAAALVGALSLAASAGCGASYVDGQPVGGHLKEPGHVAGCGGSSACPCSPGIQGYGFCGECGGQCSYCPQAAFCNPNPCDVTCPTDAQEVVPDNCPASAPIGCAGNFCCPSDYPVCCARGEFCGVDTNGCEDAVP